MPPAWIIKHPATSSRVDVIATTREKALIMAAELLSAPIDQLVANMEAEW